MFSYMQNKIIAFSGAHGTGKTTAVLELARRLKIENPKLDVGVVMETARQCPLGYLSDGRQYIDAAAQRWIFSAQIIAELEAAAKHDLVVSDRSAPDAVAYTIAGGHHELAAAMWAMAKQQMEVYRQIYFLPIGQHDWLVEDGRRNLDPTIRLRVEYHLKALYAEAGVELALWDGGRNDS
jgi:predicted ATPase